MLFFFNGKEYICIYIGAADLLPPKNMKE